MRRTEMLLLAFVLGIVAAGGLACYVAWGIMGALLYVGAWAAACLFEPQQETHEGDGEPYP